MSAIGDAIRAKKGVDKYSHDIIVNDYPVANIMHTSEIVYPYYKIPFSLLSGATKMDMVCYPDVAGEVTEFRFGWTRKSDGKVYEITSVYGREPYAPSSILTFFRYIDTNNYNTDYLYVRKIDGQSSKITTDLNYDIDPNTNYLPSEMGTEINSLLTVPESVLTLGGDCDYMFYGGHFDWLIDQDIVQIVTHEIRKAYEMFSGSNVSQIPFDIDVSSSTAGQTTSINSIFMNCKNLEKIPYIKGPIAVSGLSSIFQECYALHVIPEDWASYITNWGSIQNNTSSLTGWFNGCHSLREIPQSLISKLFNKAISSGPYTSMFNSCHVLEKLENVPVLTSTLTSNRMSSYINHTSRLSKFTFATNDDGTPKTANWKVQTFNFSDYTGYVLNNSYITSNSKYHGIDASKQVTDQASYETLKNDLDWWTSDVNYSRYNKTSAIETINSLPDTHAYGTNTIKFNGQAGSSTDGGAINTMTADEIAVAAAKGWTVTFA